MNYVEINNINKKKMHNSLHNLENHFDWEDSYILNYLLGKLPRIRDNYDDKKKSKKHLSDLRILFENYNCYSSDKEQFIDAIKKIVSKIHEEDKSWYGIDTSFVEYCLNLHSSCLISGEGGIGKSYFIYRLEEELSRHNIKHLCVYGKYQKDIGEITFEEIIDLSNKEHFVFIVDAVNELSDENINILIKNLKLLKAKSKSRVVLTYRTYSLENKYIEELKDLTAAQYNFPGISFESALEVISRLPLKNASEYTDILFTNNALLISKLIKILKDKDKITDLGSVTNITYILEHDFKEGLKFHRKSLLKDPVCYWEMTKVVVKWMFQNNSKAIPITELEKILSEENIHDYLSSLKMIGIIDVYQYKNHQSIQFSTDSLIDCLLSRSLLDELSMTDLNVSVEVLKQKIESFSSAIEYFILALFDKYKNDYGKLSELLSKVNLLDDLDLNLLVKVVVPKENICSFQKHFKLNYPVSSILYFSGLSNKPFNCTNFLNQYLLTNPKEQLKELSNCLANNYECINLSRRLKNMLYFITFTSLEENLLFEYFYTALWCSAAANQEVRILARKLLFDSIRSNSILINESIKIFPKIQDYYIKDAIIESLYFQKNISSITEFFKSLKNEKRYLSALNIARIAEYLGENNKYIYWNKANLYKKSPVSISKDFSSFLNWIEYADKDLLNFRYWSKDRIDEQFPDFLNIRKNKIVKLNNKLAKNFQCVQYGDCNGWSYFEEWIRKRYKINEKTLSTGSFLKSFERTFHRILSLYGFVDKNYSKYNHHNFNNSIECKLINISQDIFYGSLMCNYFESSFYSFNNEQTSIGYEVYNPLYYKSSENITAPIPTYDNKIEIMQNLVLQNIDYSVIKDEEWVKNASITRSNILNIICNTISFENTEWVILATQIFLQDESRSGTSWKDNYNISCCISGSVGIAGDENDRYLTIEHRYYEGLLENYSNCTEEDYLCKNVKEIAYGSGIIDETNLLLPPAKLIRELNLKPKYTNLSWINNEGVEIIRCNNNKSSYYKDFIKRSIFIRKSVLNEYLQKNRIKYFVFTEKLIPGHGFDDDTSLNFEVIEGKIVKEFKNYATRTTIAPQYEECKKCKYGLHEELERIRKNPIDISQLINFEVEKDSQLFDSENIEFF